MQIKIISMQRVVNYGSFLQAYALKKILEQKGHEVFFCDFLLGQPRHLGQKVKKITVLDKVFNLRHLLFSPNRYIGYRLFRQRIRACYSIWLKEYLGIEDNKQLDYNADLMVIGSDEVFNYTQNHAFGYVPALFGHEISARFLVSYAASAGYATIEDVRNDGMVNDLSCGLKKFDLISVRDRNTYDMVSTLTSQQPAIVLDPTLIYDFSREIEPHKLNYDYLLVYAYGERIEASFDIEIVREYARSRGLRLVSVGFYNAWCDENLIVSPFELLSIFQNANCILTDTFHGTIFSIKYKKPFASVIQNENRWGSNKGKLGFLLWQLGLEHRIVQSANDMMQLMDVPIDYQSVEAKIKELAAFSRRFIDLMLNHAEAKLNEEVA